MTKLNIAIVSYANTLPFKYALETSKNLKGYNIKYCYPAKCFELFKNNESDICLLPIGALNNLNNVQIFSDYCLSSYSKVESVLLVSQVPLNNIDTLLLDYQSKTSVLMVKILSRFYWKKNINFIDAKSGFENEISGNTAAVIIGDRALKIRNKFQFEFDLAEEWRSFTGLPAVFAVWVAKNNISAEILSKINDVLSKGIENIDSVVNIYQNLYPNIDLKHYLNNCIDYKYSSLKQKSVEVFLDYVKKL